MIICFFALAACSFPNLRADTADEKKTIKIKCEEMTCTGCKNTITKAIKALKGIEKVSVDLDTKIITVTYLESKTDPEEIVYAIIGSGYEAELIK
jgi:copper chaperone